MYVDPGIKLGALINEHCISQKKKLLQFPFYRFFIFQISQTDQLPLDPVKKKMVHTNKILIEWRQSLQYVPCDESMPYLTLSHCLLPFFYCLKAQVSAILLCVEYVHVLYLFPYVRVCRCAMPTCTVMQL